MDESFDKIVDALHEHHFDAHGVYMDGDTPIAKSWLYEETVPKRKKKAA